MKKTVENTNSVTKQTNYCLETISLSGEDHLFACYSKNLIVVKNDSTLQAYASLDLIAVVLTVGGIRTAIDPEGRPVDMTELEKLYQMTEAMNVSSTEQ